MHKNLHIDSIDEFSTRTKAMLKTALVIIPSYLLQIEIFDMIGQLSKDYRFSTILAMSYILFIS